MLPDCPMFALVGAANVLLPPNVTTKVLPASKIGTIEAASVRVTVLTLTGPLTNTDPVKVAVLVITAPPVIVTVLVNALAPVIV